MLLFYGTLLAAFGLFFPYTKFWDSVFQFIPSRWKIFGSDTYNGPSIPNVLVFIFSFFYAAIFFCLSGNIISTDLSRLMEKPIKFQTRRYDSNTEFFVYLKGEK